MKRLAAVVVLTVLCLGPGAALAGDNDVQASAQDQASKAPGTFVRTDSLELPGVTACHQCEWRPKLNHMGAGDRCGVDSTGKARMAEFECGFSEDCQRICTFLRCLAQ